MCVCVCFFKCYSNQNECAEIGFGMLPECSAQIAHGRVCLFVVTSVAAWLVGLFVGMLFVR